MVTEKHVSQIRRVIGDILLALVIFLTVNVTCVMVNKMNTVVLKAQIQDVFKYELIICAILFLFALDVRFGLFTRMKNRIVRVVGWGLRVVIAALTVVILFFCGKVIGGSLINTAGQAEHAIVLGLALENGKPAADLVSRLDTAEAYLNKNPEAKLILTGGNADESGKTEADVMHDILAERGVKDEQMILEDKAGSTKQNFRNVTKMIDPGKPVVLISSNYHMDRAVKTARSAGFTNIMRLPAPSSILNYGANVLSEVVLEVNELTLRR